MDDYLNLQMKGLREVVYYSQKLLPVVEDIIFELRNGRKQDTGEILNLVILGINWEIEMYNYCEKLVNADRSVIDKKQMTSAVNNLGVALKSAEDAQIAQCLEKDFLPFLKTLEKASKQALLGDFNK